MTTLLLNYSTDAWRGAFDITMFALYWAVFAFVLGFAWGRKQPHLILLFFPIAFVVLGLNELFYWGR